MQKNELDVCFATSYVFTELDLIKEQLSQHVYVYVHGTLYLNSGKHFFKFLLGGADDCNYTINGQDHR